jgi:coenzyme F420-reducing hydrogenase alpha subunit
MNLHFERLPEPVRRLAEEVGIAWPSRNLFHSMTARALEIVFALRRALELLEGYAATGEPFVAVTPRAGIGFGATEAPRGLLWHRYELDSAGAVISARIVPPTSQNQARIEEDLRASLMRLGLARADDELRQHAEMVIRNYDPCISCATHFLNLKVDR